MATTTDLPVSADLENGYGDSPEIVSEFGLSHPPDLIFKRAGDEFLGLALRIRKPSPLFVNGAIKFEVDIKLSGPPWDAHNRGERKGVAKAVALGSPKAG